MKDPGDLVQVDTLDVRHLPGVVLKHFTARDVVSRWDVVEVHTRATATLAAGFLDAIQQRMPFQVRSIQVDGGSEFQAAFEQACQKRGLRLFVLPPRSPKLNGCVERAQRTHTEEFYEITDFSLEVATLNQELQVWECTYNTVRPHQALAYLTPHQFSLSGNPNNRRQCVTNLLDEYRWLTRGRAASTLRDARMYPARNQVKNENVGGGRWPKDTWYHRTSRIWCRWATLAMPVLI